MKKFQNRRSHFEVLLVTLKSSTQYWQYRMFGTLNLHTRHVYLQLVVYRRSFLHLAVFVRSHTSIFLPHIVFKAFWMQTQIGNPHPRIKKDSDHKFKSIRSRLCQLIFFNLLFLKFLAPLLRTLQISLTFLHTTDNIEYGKTCIRITFNRISWSCSHVYSMLSIFQILQPSQLPVLSLTSLLFLWIQSFSIQPHPSPGNEWITCYCSWSYPIPHCCYYDS